MGYEQWGAAITGIGHATTGLRLMTNDDVARELRATEPQVRSWIHSEASIDWWGSDDPRAKALREKYEPKFLELTGHPLNYRSRTDRMTLWHSLLIEELRTDDQWIFERTGIRMRYWADANTTTSDMAAEAGKRAMQMAGLTADDIDGLVVASVSPDEPHCTPTLTGRIMLKCGLGRSPSNFFFADTPEACSSFSVAMAHARRAIYDGTCQNVLVIGADKMTTTRSPYDRGLVPILADDGRAVMMSRVPIEQDALPPRGFFSRAVPEFADLIIVPAGGSRIAVTPQMVANPFDRRDLMRMMGREVMNEIPPILLPKRKGQAWQDKWADTFIPSALRHYGLPMLTIDDLSAALSHFKAIIPHQANDRIIEIIRERCQKDLGYRGIIG
ncbi:MAG: hypothetical protein HY093_00295, partial [Candidatus Liptonbacteria bacterium]|nr:hypothetical protein [Candidatus Liptonbacteria bacterium]